VYGKFYYYRIASEQMKHENEFNSRFEARCVFFGSWFLSKFFREAKITKILRVRVWLVAESNKSLKT
jgi:hypothetical protein